MAGRANGKTPGADSNPPEAAEAGGYASPACALAEADPAYSGYMIREELIAFLNLLLEGEQAGVKVANGFLDTASEETVGLLRQVRRDEAHYAALLARLIRDLGGVPSARIGAFYERAMAIQGLPERLAFLNRGQGWVVRKLEEALPRIAEDAVHAALREMLETHKVNIAQCEPYCAPASGAG